jgi:hypothetical protein|tara:strand:- start:73 stop:264 length:192 start_codon:yes stop_codon:yes gene_type:complete
MEDIKYNKIMEEETKQLVMAYVHKHYSKMFGELKPIIKEFDNHFQISKSEDSSPLILGKGIIK